jgi:tetratricopeptide (TPR) repeat protein
MCLGRVRQAVCRTGEAEKAFRRSIVLYEALRADRLTRIAYTFLLASLYADCPVEPLRDLPRAVELAKKLVRFEPRASPHWVTLGVAHFHQGEWNAAAAALETSFEQKNPDTGRGNFYLAMTYARQGDADRARRSFEQAVKWMDKNQPRNPDLVRLRAEARAVLDTSDPR